MKYVVEVCYGNRNEWSDEIECYEDARDYALAMSELADVSEARVWLDDEIIDTCVNGTAYEDWVDEEEDEWAKYDEPHFPFDEWVVRPPAQMNLMRIYNPHYFFIFFKKVIKNT